MMISYTLAILLSFCFFTTLHAIGGDPIDTSVVNCFSRLQSPSRRVINSQDCANLITDLLIEFQSKPGSIMFHEGLDEGEYDPDEDVLLPLSRRNGSCLMTMTVAGRPYQDDAEALDIIQAVSVLQNICLKIQDFRGWGGTTMIGDNSQLKVMISGAFLSPLYQQQRLPQQTNSSTIETQ